MHIVIVEDEPAIRQELKLLLENALYKVTALSEFQDAASAALAAEPDLILLDIRLPGESGFDVCTKIRAVSEVPIIFLTSRTDAADELNGMLKGGDDYVTKPFYPPLLLARITAVLKRTKRAAGQEREPDRLVYRGVELDIARGSIRCQDSQAELTKNEFKILYYLFQNTGRIIPRIELIEYLWDNQVFIDDNTLSVNMTRIRAKLEQIGAHDLVETKRRILLYVLHLVCMIALGGFLLATGYHRDACLLIWICWLLVLSVWSAYEYRRRKRYFSQMEAVLARIDQRYLLGELMPFSGRLEDRLYREMIRRSNGAVIERIHAVEETREDYREYIESWVHEIKAPITSVALMCENHRSEVTRNIGTENGKIENYVDMALYYARSDEVYRDYLIQETDLGAVAAEVVGRSKYYFIQNAVQVAIDCSDPVYTDKKWIAFILNQILQNSLKYRRETGARIRIYTEKEKRGVRLTVEDNGIGIKAEELPRIFEKNFTGTNGRNHERSTGMGLYLCGKLCAKLGIGIRAESEEHAGTKVVLEFPISTYIRAEGN